MPFEQGLIRVDRGQFIDKGNYHYDPRHPDFAGGADPDGLRDSYQAFVECDAAAVAAGASVVVGPGTYKIAASITLSAAYDFMQGAAVKPDEGVTVTFNAQIRGLAARTEVLDTSAGGSFTANGGEWFYNEHGWANGAGMLDMGGMVKNVLAYDVPNDGTTDATTAIQAVLDDAVAGDIIYFPAGDYKVTADLDLETSGVTVLGIGQQARIFTTDEAVNVFEVAAGISDILIEGLYLQAGARDWAADANRDLGNCIFVASTSASRSTNIRVKNNRLADGHLGALIRYTNYAECSGNLIEVAHEAWQGIGWWGCNHGVIHKNRIVSTGATGVADALTAIELNDTEAGVGRCDFNLVSNNAIKGTWRLEGINVHSAHNTIVGNTVEITGTCVQLLQGANSPAASCYRNVVADNVFRTENDTLRVVGIKDDTAAAHPGANYNRVYGNIIEQVGAAAGVIINDYCQYNVIEDNDIIGGDGATSDGVIVVGTGATHNKVRFNDISGAGRYGLYANSCNYTEAVGNEIRSCANGARFESCSGVTWMDNHTHDNTTTSVVFASVTGFVRMSGNVSVNETAPNLAGALVAFTANDATPSVRNGTHFKTANNSATTITAFDDGVQNQRIWVQINDANTTIDCTSTNIKISGRTTDYVAASGDVLEGGYDGSNWRMVLHKQVFKDDPQTWTAVQIFEGETSNSGVLATRVEGDAVNRWVKLAGGEENYGNGTGAADVRVGRTGVDMWGTLDAGDSLFTTGSAYNEGHFQMSTWEFWVDGSGFLRLKNGAPASATDGAKMLKQSTNLTATLPADGTIAALTFSATPTQAECNALRDQCELLRDYIADLVSKAGIT